MIGPHEGWSVSGYGYGTGAYNQPRLQLYHTTAIDIDYLELNGSIGVSELTFESNDSLMQRMWIAERLQYN